MDNLTRHLGAEAESIRQAYAALNRNDIDGFVKDFDPEIERIEPPDFPSGGTYHGLEAVKAHITKGRSTWAEGSCEPTGFVTAGDKVVVLLQIHVRLNGRTDWSDGRIADVFTFRNGKVVQFRTFGEESEAMEFAGVDVQ